MKMSKWIWNRFMGKPKKEIMTSEPCCECGLPKTRQTTLEEFGFKFPIKGQTKLTDFYDLFEPAPVTMETVGIDGEPRKYRGNI